MPTALRYLSYTALAATVLTFVVIVFGPQEGLETLAGGLLAYFALLFHIAIGPYYLYHWYKTRRVSLGLGFMLCYFVVIYGTGLYYYITINKIDDSVLDRVDAYSNPENHRLRDLGKQLYFQQKTGSAISQDDLAEWARLVTEVNSVNQKDTERRPALWYAAAMGNSEMVTRLLAHGAKTDDPSLYTTTPLGEAVKEGHVDVVRILIAAGANPNEGKNKHYPALSLAVKEQNISMIKTLIQGGADLDLGDPAPFSIALGAKRSDIIALLLEAGTKPIGRHNKLPIEYALDNEDEATVQILLAKTDGFESRTSVRDPILFQLIHACNVSDFARYIKMGADPNVINNKGMSILSKIIMMNFRNCDLSEFVRVLIHSGANFDLVNDRDESLLLLSLGREHPKIARLLVEAGASILGEIHGRDFIMLAARNGMTDLIDVAIDKGFDVNRWSIGLNQTGPLHEAARAGHINTVRYLIDKGARLPDEDVNISSLFRFAADHPEGLKLLLNLYINTDRTRLTDTTIKSRVRDSKNEVSIALLEEFGIR